MPERSTRLSQIEIRSLYQAALGASSSGAGWLPPEPAQLAPFFPGYEIEALIARGGMGAVYRARQLSLGRTVAIKLLPFDLGVREDFAERFRREATALARLNHPHIVAIHDFGQADDGHYFMVMEHVEGSDLAARLRTGGPLPPDEALRIVRQVCDALDFAHRQGVVHRDIKPANILLDAAGRVKVSDFGIAQFAHEETARGLTATGTLLGTPDYTAPEQLTPQAAVDQRADIFSVGVMLYELLTGQLPRGVFRPASELAPVARGIDAVLARAMQSEPGRRYSAITELTAELVESRPLPRRGSLPRKLALAAALLTATGALWWFTRTPPPFTNSLGLTFFPAGTPGVLFATTETRVQDYEAFSRVRGDAFSRPIFMNYDGTQAGWTMKNTTWRTPGFAQAADHPVVGISHVEAVEFCDWLTQHERGSGRIGAADRYRLPTDAEWSVAAGLSADAHDPAGAYPWGAPFPPPANAGNYAGEELRAHREFKALPVIGGRRDSHPCTAPVGSYPANRHGLRDMGGNVTEWLHHEGDGLVTVRGGSWWHSAANDLDAGHRDALGEEVRSFVIGFRLVLERSAKQ